jgi:electron transport complex protein RnfC
VSTDPNVPDPTEPLAPALADSAVTWPREAPQFAHLGEPWIPAVNLIDFATRIHKVGASLSMWIERLHQAQVIADRHNSPDLVAQLSHALRRPVDTVICGILDVDPAACINSALLSRYPLELLAGLATIGRVVSAQRVALITDARVPSGWFPRLRKTCLEIGIRAEALINDYPQADPTLMLYSLLGRRLRPGRLPTEAGVILFDAAAAIAVGRHLLLDEPMRQTPLVLRDHTTNQSSYLVVPVGMTLGDICQQIRLPCRGRVLRSGDLLRDVQVSPETIVGGGELVYHSAAPSPDVNPAPCIRCGWCVDSCPTGVQPAAVLEAAQRNDIDMAEQAGMEACIECGICSYVCPASLPLLVGIQKMKLRAARATYAIGSSDRADAENHANKRP